MMLPGQQGQFYGQWPQQPYMADQIPNNQGYQVDRNPYGNSRDFQDPQGMNGPRFVNPFMNQNLPSREELSRASSFTKSKKGSTKPKSVTARPIIYSEHDGLLNSETIDTIRSIKDDISYLERDLTFTFKNYKKITPFYNLPKPPKEVEIPTTKSTRPPTPNELVSHPKQNPKKVNKYIQNYLEKYEPDEPVSQVTKPNVFQELNHAEFNSTIPKPTKAPEQKAVSKPQKTSHELYKKLQPVQNDSMSFDGSSRPRDQYQTLTLDQEGINFDSNIHSLRNSQVSRASTGSKRRESFENFKRQYFQDTSVRPNLIPPQAVSKKFTR